MFELNSMDKFEKSLYENPRNKFDKTSAKRYVKDFRKASVNKNNKQEINNLNNKYKHYFATTTETGIFSCYFLSDTANFTAPLPPVMGTWGKRIAKIGDNKVGNIFLKKAQNVARYDGAGKLIKQTYGIADSGRTIRKTPLAIAGLGAAGYGAYRGKKTYDKYQPEIKTGLRLAKMYDQLKNKFGGEN